jgi:hypothetical protein
VAQVQYGPLIQRVIVGARNGLHGGVCKRRHGYRLIEAAHKHSAGARIECELLVHIEHCNVLVGAPDDVLDLFAR